MTEQVARKKDLPVWLGILLIVIAVAAGGWFVWSQVSGYWTGTGGVFSIEGADPAKYARPSAGPIARRGRNAPPPQPVASITQRNDNTWQARTGTHIALVRKQGEGKYRSSLLAYIPRAIPSDSSWVMMAKNKLDDAAAGQIGLSPEQVKQFKDLPVSPRMTLPFSAEENERLQAIFVRYIAAPEATRIDIDREFSQTLDQAANRVIGPVPAAIKKQYDDLRNAIGDAKWQKLKELTSGTPAAAAP